MYQRMGKDQLRGIVSAVANEKWNGISTYEKKQILKGFEDKEICVCSKLLDLRESHIDLEEKRFVVYEFVDEANDYSIDPCDLIFEFDISVDEALTKRNLTSKDKIVEVTGKVRFVSVWHTYPSMHIEFYIQASSITPVASDWMTAEFLKIPDYFDKYKKPNRYNDEVPSLKRKNGSSGIGCSLFVFLAIIITLIITAVQ
jgi:hypothetical protein